MWIHVAVVLVVSHGMALVYDMPNCACCINSRSYANMLEDHEAILSPVSCSEWGVAV
jgi:hypothetical protein